MLSPRLRNSGIFLGLLAYLVSSPVWAEEPSLPKVALIGDSIRLSYAGKVVQQLDGKATILSPPQNGGDSRNVLGHIDAWAVKPQPDVVHFNCGIHDTKKFKSSGTFQVSPQDYAANLRKIVERIRADTNAVVLFSTSTPILDDRAAKTRADRDYALLNASIEQYNEIAKEVMAELNVPVNDLHAALTNAGENSPLTKLIVADGVHLTPLGRTHAAQSVARFVESHLPRAEQ